VISLVVSAVLLGSGATGSWGPALTIGCDAHSTAGPVAVDPDQDLVVVKSRLASTERGTAVWRIAVWQLNSGELVASRDANVLPSDAVAIGPGPVVAYTTEEVTTVAARPLTLWWPATGKTVVYNGFGLEEADADRSKPRIMATSAPNLAFAPDGSQLALIGARTYRGQETPLLLILDVNTGAFRQFGLPQDVSAERGLREVRWGPAGDRVFLLAAWQGQAPTTPGRTQSELHVFTLEVEGMSWRDMGKAPAGAYGIDGHAEFLISDGSAGAGKLALPRMLSVEDHYRAGRMTPEAALALPALELASLPGAVLSNIYRGWSNTYAEVYVRQTGSLSCARFFKLRGRVE
jgi:hypothetical protein